MIHAGKQILRTDAVLFAWPFNGADGTVSDAYLTLEETMWLLAFAILALFIGNDLRKRGFEAIGAVLREGTAHLVGYHAVAMGGWISFAGAICLNIAVWSLF